MGTSLSGLTPATTFDGLLKTSDNEPLDGTLKTIGTGDGTDSILQLSNSALSIGGDVVIDSSGINGLIVKRSGTELLKSDGSGLNGGLIFTGNLTNKFSLGVNGNDFNIWDGSYLGGGDLRFSILADGKTGIGNQTPTAQLHIKGSGASSGTTSLLVQNSAGTQALKVTDDGAIDFGILGLEFSNDGSGGTMSAASDRYIKLASSLNTYSALNAHVFKTLGSGGYSEAMRITGNTDQFVGIGETTPTAKLHVKAGTTQDVIARFQDPLQTWSYIDIKNDSVLTDYTGIYWGSKAKIRSKEVGPVFIDCSGGISFLDGNSSKSNINSQGAIAIGANAAPASTMAYIKGSGASSGTTALLVQNSAGTEHLKITDDGVVNVRQALNVNHITNSLRSLRLGWGSIYATDNASELSIGAVYSQTTAPTIILGGKTRAGGADAVLVQALNGMYLSTTANAENPSAQLHIKGSGNDATTTALLVQNSDGDDKFKVTDAGGTEVTTNETWKLTLQSNDLSQFLKFSSNNIYTTGPLYLSGSTTTLQGNGVPRVIAAATGTTIKGSGTTSATNALLVQNSAGTELMKVTDGGPTYIKSAVFTTSTQFRGYVDANNNSNLNFIVPSSGNSFVISKSYNPSNDASALLDVQSTTQGFLPPRMTTTERDLISTPSAGLMVYNTTTNKAQCYNGTAWQDLF